MSHADLRKDYRYAQVPLQAFNFRDAETAGTPTSSVLLA